MKIVLSSLLSIIWNNNMSMSKFFRSNVYLAINFFLRIYIYFLIFFYNYSSGIKPKINCLILNQVIKSSKLQVFISENTNIGVYYSCIDCRIVYLSNEMTMLENSEFVSNFTYLD